VSDLESLFFPLVLHTYQVSTTSLELYFSRVADDNGSRRPLIVGRARLNGLENGVALNNAPKALKLAIHPATLSKCDEELAADGVGLGRGPADHSAQWVGKVKGEIFVG
jgi:hypothetical protein